jgi:hypothetical protein
VPQPDFAELALMQGPIFQFFQLDLQPFDYLLFWYLEKALRADIVNHGIELHLKSILELYVETEFYHNGR